MKDIKDHKRLHKNGWNHTKHDISFFHLMLTISQDLYQPIKHIWNQYFHQI